MKNVMKSSTLMIQKLFTLTAWITCSNKAEI